jgi:hypothetical protein
MFKGGTSLSKAYGLISRFSEDVDILVACEGYGAGAWEKRVLRPICERVAVDLGLSEQKVSMRGYKEGFTRNADYLYPSRLGSSAIRAATRLDADYDELARVEVDVIAPVLGRSAQRRPGQHR